MAAADRVSSDMVPPSELCPCSRRIGGLLDVGDGESDDMEDPPGWTARRTSGASGVAKRWAVDSTSEPPVLELAVLLGRWRAAGAVDCC
ncbi:hypothetical protein GCM10023350_45800 [Nocardioides endophyticus]|uniref:Uncharacterized protein n=1 Tax=Nocardioides endophyticus TaxID=1353775 RepID=A0ABP8ZFM6_9ACTN